MNYETELLRNTHRQGRERERLNQLGLDLCGFKNIIWNQIWMHECWCNYIDRSKQTALRRRIQLAPLFKQTEKHSLRMFLTKNVSENFSENDSQSRLLAKLKKHSHKQWRNIFCRIISIAPDCFCKQPFNIDYTTDNFSMHRNILIWECFSILARSMHSNRMFLSLRNCFSQTVS